MINGHQIENVFVPSNKCIGKLFPIFNNDGDTNS